MAGWAGILYGSDTLNTEAFPDKTTVEALATLSTAAITLSFADPDPKLEGEEITYSDGTMEGKKHYRTEYEFKIVNKRFPSTNTTIESYFHTDILTKKYKWIYLGTYPLQPNGIISALPTTAKCLPIIITGRQTNTSESWKELIYNAKSKNKDT